VVVRRKKNVILIVVNVLGTVIQKKKWISD